MVTSDPKRRACIAAERPAGPPPMITTERGVALSKELNEKKIARQKNICLVFIGKGFLWERFFLSGEY